MINYHSLVMYKRPGHTGDTSTGAWILLIGPGPFAGHYFAKPWYWDPILARRPFSNRISKWADWLGKARNLRRDVSAGP